MAKDKKSFVLYTDLIHTVKKLDKEKAGELFLHILEYVNDNDPKTNDVIIDLVFEPIKQQLKRDLKRYEDRAERSRQNGKNGGRPSTKQKPSGLNNNPENPNEPKKPDSVNGNDTVSDTDNVIYPFTSKRFIEVWELWKQDRKDRKIKKYTPIGEQGALHKLFTDSGENEEIAIEIINQSICNGYQGLFPLKNKPNTGQNAVDKFSNVPD